MIAGSMSGVAFCIEHSCRFDENVGLPGARSSVSTEALEHDPEKWKPIFGKDHAQTKS
jgi:hypothetical protein